MDKKQPRHSIKYLDVENLRLLDQYKVFAIAFIVASIVLACYCDHLQKKIDVLEHKDYDYWKLDYNGHSPHCHNETWYFSPEFNSTAPLYWYGNKNESWIYFIHPGETSILLYQKEVCDS